MGVAAAPGAPFRAFLEEGVSGLADVALAIYEGDTEVDALSVENLTEISTSGIYVAERTAPATPGDYVLVWSADGTLDPDQVRTEALAVTSPWLEEVETGYTANDLLRLMAAVLLGKSSGGGTATRVFRDVNDSVNRVTATVESDGDRPSVALDPS